MNGIIHQIFLKVSDKTINDYPCYVEGIKLWKEWCKDHGYEYKLWTDIPYELLDEKDKEVLEEATKRFYFAPIDFIRMPILENYGGMYVDLDVHPTDKLINIMDRENIFGTGYNGKKEFLTNNVMKCSKENAGLMRLYSHKCFDEKIKIKIYDKWKIRFFLRTMGACMVSNFCTREMKIKHIPFDEWNEYFKDHYTLAWSN
jgi:mannosyltransferase OCH1-like enzyme